MYTTQVNTWCVGAQICFVALIIIYLKNFLVIQLSEFFKHLSWQLRIQIFSPNCTVQYESANCTHAV